MKNLCIRAIEELLRRQTAVLSSNSHQQYNPWGYTYRPTPFFITLYSHISQHNKFLLLKLGTNRCYSQITIGTTTLLCHRGEESATVLLVDSKQLQPGAFNKLFCSMDFQLILELSHKPAAAYIPAITT